MHLMWNGYMQGCCALLSNLSLLGGWLLIMTKLEIVWVCGGISGLKYMYVYIHIYYMCKEYC